MKKALLKSHDFFFPILSTRRNGNYKEIRVNFFAVTLLLVIGWGVVAPFFGLDESGATAGVFAAAYYFLLPQTLIVEGGD